MGHVGTDMSSGGLMPLPGMSEDPRVSSVLERLGNLEGRVGQQLDHLLRVQEQQVGHIQLPCLHPVVMQNWHC